jgi:hypothetical protein
MNKKAQITAFIIVGLVLVLALFTIIFLNSYRVEVDGQAVLPQNIVPVKSYIESCVNDVSKNAVIQMGRQGGYISLPDEIELVRPSYIGYGSMSIEKIPYWKYNTQIRMPTLDYMNEELRIHINESLDMCVQGLSVFDSTFNFKFHERDVEVIFGDKEIIIIIYFPIDVRNKLGIQSTRLEKFQTTIPVRIRQIHKLAEDIFHQQNSELFLENLTMEFITGDFGFPISGIEFQCTPLKWSLYDLENKLKNILYYNLIRIRVRNTDYLPFLESEEKYVKIQEEAEKITQYLHEADYSNGKDPFEDALKTAGINPDEIPDDIYEFTKLTFNPNSKDVNLKAKFIYMPEWGMHFKANPSEGGIMTSRMMGGAKKFLSFLCLQMYHFTYDVSYPVEVRIIDEESFKVDGGYTFRYAIPVTISENQPLKEHMQEFSYNHINPRFDFCTETDGVTKEIEVKGIYEGYRDMSIPDVNLTYQCMNYYCDIGKTESQDGTYIFKGTIPANCVNPMITASKENYLESTAQLTDDYLSMEIEKLESVKVNFTKYLYYDSDERLDITNTPNIDIDKNESVLLYISLENSSETFIQYFGYNRAGKDLLTTNLSFLTSGAHYSINAFLRRGDKIIGGYIDENFEVTTDDIYEKEQLYIPIIEYRPFPISSEQEMDLMNYIFMGDYLNKVSFKFE